MQKPKELKAKVKNKEWISDQVVKIDFKLINEDEFAFEPGQHINMKIDDNAVRPYSIYSDLKADDELSIVVSAAHDGVGSNYLRNLKINEEVDMFGPAGKLRLSQETKPNIVFLATGTGVVPFMTMINRLIKEGCESNIKLYFGVRDRADIFFKEKFEQFKKDLLNFDYEICLSNPKQTWEDCLGYVTGATEIDSTGNTQYYVCGVPSMVSDTVEKLKSEGVAEEDIIK